MATCEITGTADVVRNLNAAIGRITGRTEASVLKAADLISRRAGEKTPVDTGNLKGGRTVTSVGTETHPEAAVSYHAEYAPYVHENLEAHHPVGSAKFLELAVAESQDDVVRIIAEEAKS